MNLNLGCPSGTVAAKGKGSGFLAFPEELEAFFERIFSEPGMPRVSVKTRLGVEDPAEFAALLDIYRRFPISELIVHPRVRRDMYKLPARPEFFPEDGHALYAIFTDAAALLDYIETYKAEPEDVWKEKIFGKYNVEK